MATQSSNTKVLIKGSCACSRLTYHITTLPTSTSACHCITCQKVSGSAFQAVFDVPPSSIIFFFDAHQPSSTDKPYSLDTVPGLALVRLSAHADRGCCATCHSWLMMRYDIDRARNVSIMLSSVDQQSYAGDGEVREALRVKRHIFASQKAPWMGADWLVGEAQRGMVYDRFPSKGFEEAMKKGTGME